MVAQTQTGPNENPEKLDRKKNEKTNHGEQVRWTSKTCREFRTKNTVFENAIQEFHQGKKTKDELKELFKKELKNIPAATAKKMGIVTLDESGIDDFLNKTGCFENQMMFQIHADKTSKQRAEEELISDALGIASEEFGNFDQTELKELFQKEIEESPNRIKLFLESSKFRKSVIKKLPGSTNLTTKSFNDINFEEITQKIGNLAGTDIEKRREIQESWLKITSIAQPGENLAEAFARITESGAMSASLAGAYQSFFGDTNTLISRENREKILNFLTRQYIPVVPFGVVESVDPSSAKKYITHETDQAIIDSNTVGDELFKGALIKEKKKEWEMFRKTTLGNGTGIISTHGLPFDTKIKLLSQFGSIGKAEQMEEYYRGRPDSLRTSTMTNEDYAEVFEKTYNFEPARVETHSGLTAELESKLGKKIHGIEHFKENSVMQWKTKTKDGEEKIGYYIVDTVLSDDLDDAELITVRFLGDNKDPLSPTGLAMHYSGADFYHYLSGCSEDGIISFIPREEFEATIKENEKENKLPHYIKPEETYKELRKKFPEEINVPDFESFNREVDTILNPRGDSDLESKNAQDRELHEGMVFICGGKEIDTFQIKSIGENEITLWDGWGSSGNSQHEQTLSFQEFILTIKNLKASKGIYRLNTNQKPLGVSMFNTICANKEQYAGAGDNADGLVKKFKQVRINKDGDEFKIGQTNDKTGSFEPASIIKIGEKKDICIESISDDGTVRYRQGTFTQSKFDKVKNVITQKPEFRGTGVRSMSLSNLWAYMYNNSGFELQTPKEEYEKQVKEEKGGDSLSWWNILMHTHSLGVILHGDLWSAPFKAWEEQHHKDHAFAGKMTAALAMEKLQNANYPVVSSVWNWAEWPSLMVADGNGSFHSYLNELVEKVDGMGSFHRTRLIKKWAKKEHFPSVKFMAAMMSSMKIFGHLYPYSFDGDYEDDHGSHDWFWYNSINHALGHKHPHMPPHEGDEWPSKWISKAGYKMNETEVCNKLFNEFQHPMLRNLGRRFQKYMNGGQEHLQDGAKGNLEQRTSKEEKLEWMMSALCSSTGKLPEGFGEGTELWLTEGYPVETTSMPYAALLFSCRDKLLMQPTREHIRKQFQDGYHMPLFCFMQEQDQGEVFREAGVAFAYTISMKCGKKLEDLVKRSSVSRLQGTALKQWSKEFESFWSEYGKEMMFKIAGMKDPMLQLIVNEPAVYDELLDAQPPEKREMYNKVREKKDVLRAFHSRMEAVYDSPSHCQMKRDKGYYDGDNFRFRDAFPSGFGGMPWVNWDAYIDSNLEDRYAAGQLGSTSGDGVFNEFRAFLYAIPDMAEKMVEDMGFTDSEQKKKFIDKISRSLHKKTVDGVGRLMKQKIDATNPKAEYCSMTAMMFEIIPVQKMTKSSSNAKEESRFEKYYEQMQACVDKAREIEKDPNGGYAASMKYREKMAKKWSIIVKGEINTQNVTIDDIYQIEDLPSINSAKKIQEDIQSRSGEILSDKRAKFEEEARNPQKSQTYGRNISPTNGSSHRNQNHREEEIGLSA